MAPRHEPPRSRSGVVDEVFTRQHQPATLAFCGAMRTTSTWSMTPLAECFTAAARCTVAGRSRALRASGGRRNLITFVRTRKGKLETAFTYYSSADGRWRRCHGEGSTRRPTVPPPAHADIGDECIDDPTTEAEHHRGKIGLEDVGEHGLRLEDILQLGRRHAGIHSIEDGRRDPPARLIAHAESTIDVAREDAVVHGKQDLDEDVVMGLRLHPDMKFLSQAIEEHFCKYDALFEPATVAKQRRAGGNSNARARNMTAS